MCIAYQHSQALAAGRHAMTGWRHVTQPPGAAAQHTLLDVVLQASSHVDANYVLYSAPTKWDISGDATAAGCLQA